MADTDHSPVTINTVIIVALEVEEKAIVGALGRHTTHPWYGNDLPLATIDGRTILVVRLEAMGNTGSAQATERAIAIWNPAQIILVGIAAGISAGDGMLLGDVLVADQVVGYELAKLTAAGAARRYEVYRPASDLLAAARSVRPHEWADHLLTPRPDDPHGRVRPRSHIGVVLSGEKVIADEAAVAELRQAWPKAIGIEMEGIGIALASYRNGPGFLLVKAVSDRADEAKDDAWQPYAAEAAARFTVATLTRLAPAAPAGPRSQAAPATAARSFSGAALLQVCRQLDNWVEVARYFDVKPWERRRFDRGNEPHDLCDYLENRGKLYALPDALDAVDRPDLATILRDSLR